MTLPASAEPEFHCSAGLSFRVAGPAGWQSHAEPSDTGVTIAFIPPGTTLDDSAVAISVSVPTPEKSAPAGPDLDHILERRLGMLSLLGDPIEIRDSWLRHPQLPSRSAQMTLPVGSLHYAVIDGRMGEGRHFIASLARQGREASDDELEGFEATLASLRFDPSRSCLDDSDAKSRSTVSKAPPAAPGPDPATGGSLSKRQIAERRAVTTCTLLGRMYVPIECRYSNVVGGETLIATLSDGDEPAESYLERFRDRVAVTYCWAREAHELPGLFFRTSSGGSELGALREYSCAKRDWTRS